RRRIGIQERISPNHCRRHCSRADICFYSRNWLGIPSLPDKKESCFRWHLAVGLPNPLRNNCVVRLCFRRSLIGIDNTVFDEELGGPLQPLPHSLFPMSLLP